MSYPSVGRYSVVVGAFGIVEKNRICVCVVNEHYSNVVNYLEKVLYC